MDIFNPTNWEILKIPTPTLQQVTDTWATTDKNIGANGIQLDVTPTVTASAPWLIQWNTVDGTYDMWLLNSSVLQVWQETMFYWKASGAIANWELCQFAGVQGDHILIKKAVGSEIEANPHFLVWVATENIANGNFWYITWFGKINWVYTKTPANQDSVDWVAGDILYFNVTTGQLTKTMPSVPNRIITVAAVIKEQTGASENWIILVRPTFWQKLQDLDDVNGTTPVDGSIPSFHLASGYFDFDKNINDYATTQVQDLWNPVILSPALWDYTFPNTIYTPLAAVQAYKKYNNTITLTAANNWNNITLYQAAAAAGTLKIGINNALQNILLSTIASSWGLTIDHNGYSNTMKRPTTTNLSAFILTNTSASASTVTLDGTGTVTLNTSVRKPSGDLNVVVTGSGDVTWSATPVVDNNFGTFTIGGGISLIDNNTILAKATQIILNAGNSVLQLSTIDYSAKMRFDNGGACYIRNGSANCNLNTSFGNNTAWTPSTSVIYFTGVSATNWTNLGASNTWSGNAGLITNAYVKFGNAGCLGTGALLTFVTWPWRIDNSSGAPLTITKNITFQSANTLTFDGAQNLTFTGTTTHTMSAAVTITTSGSVLSFDGVNFAGAFVMTKTGTWELYVKWMAGGMTVNLGIAACNSMGALIIANTLGATFKCIDHATNGIISQSTSINLGGSNARVMFSWNDTNSRFTYMTTGTAALAGAGLIFSWAAVNGTYDIIVGAGTMSGTLPTVASNTTGKTLVLSQVGNTLKVTVS